MNVYNVNKISIRGREINAVSKDVKNLSEKSAVTVGQLKKMDLSSIKDFNSIFSLMMQNNALLLNDKTLRDEYYDLEFIKNDYTITTEVDISGVLSGDTLLAAGSSYEDTSGMTSVIGISTYVKDLHAGEVTLWTLTPGTKLVGANILINKSGKTVNIGDLIIEPYASVMVFFDTNGKLNDNFECHGSGVDIKIYSNSYLAEGSTIEGRLSSDYATMDDIVITKGSILTGLDIIIHPSSTAKLYINDVSYTYSNTSSSNLAITSPDNSSFKFADKYELKDSLLPSFDKILLLTDNIQEERTDMIYKFALPDVIRSTSTKLIIPTEYNSSIKILATKPITTENYSSGEIQYDGYTINYIPK